MKRIISLVLCTVLTLSVGFFYTNTVNADFENELILKYNTIGNQIYLPYGKTLVDYCNEFPDIDISANSSTGEQIKAYMRLHKGNRIKCIYGDNESEYDINIIGDLSGDGNITVLDITKIRKLILDGDNTSDNVIKTDSNRDGEITVADLCQACDYAVSNSEVVYNSKLMDRLNTLYKNNLNIFSGLNVFESTYTSNEFDNMIKSSVTNNGNATRVANVMRKALRGEELTFVFFGGSITQGSGAGANQNYVALFKNWFNSTFGARCNINVKFINAGIGSTDTVFASHRVYQDVLSYKPDLVFMEFCVNDSASMLYKAGTYESTVRRILSNGTALVMLSMACSNGATSEALHTPIAKAYDVPMISYKKAFYDTTFYNSSKYELSDDNTHPNVAGHNAVFMLLENYFTNIYNELPDIGFTDSKLPIEPVYENGADYYNGRIVDLCNIKSSDKVTIVNKGAFISNKDFLYSPRFNSFNYKYYGFAAATLEKMNTVKPLILTVQNCKNLFIEMLREPIGCKAKIEVLEGTSVVKTTTVDSGYSSTHIWATEQLYHSDTAKTITVKITPDFSGVVFDEQEGKAYYSSFTIAGLLVS